MARTQLVKPLNPTWRKHLATDLADTIAHWERRTLKDHAAKVTNAADLWRTARIEYDVKASSALTAIKLHARKLARMARVVERVESAWTDALESGDAGADALGDLYGRAVVELAARQEIHAGVMRKIPAGDPGTLPEFLKAKTKAFMGARSTFADMKAVLARIAEHGVSDVTDDEARAWGTRFNLSNVVL